MKQIKTLTFYSFIVYSSILIFIGLFISSPVPIFLSLPFIWLMFFSELLPFKKIRVKREIEEKRFIEGDKIKIKYEIEGSGYYRIYDELDSIRGFLKEKKKEEKDRILKRFGILKIREMHIESEDFLGMKKYEEIKKEEKDIKIYPKIEYVRRFRINPRRTRSLLGDYPSRRKGIGTEFTDIREYQSGDSMRWINWKATARKDKIMVNEFESERTGDTVIVLDVRRFYKGEKEYEELLNHSVRAAAMLATYLSRTKNRVGFVFLGNSVDWIYPNYGKRAMYLILERLLTARSKKISRLPFEYGKFIVSRFFPPNSFIIIVSPLLSWDIDEAIVELLAKKYDVLIISPTIIGTKNDIASKILRSERDVRLRRLRMYSRVIDWNIEYPLSKMLMVMK